MQYQTKSLYLPEKDFRFLFHRLGPSLGLWRAAEIAALREVTCDPPVLDLGAGDGLITARVLRRVEIGLDPDRVALKNAAALGVYDQFIARPMEESGLAPNTLGTVISNSVLEHVARIDDALAASASALRPGGRLIFTAPTEAFSHWLTLPTARYAAKRNQHFQHLNLWPAEEWAARLEQAGLQVECVRPYLRRGLVRAWDMLELMQMIYLPRGRGRVRVFGKLWRGMPQSWVDALARCASRLDLSAPAPGGGRLIIARKPV